ncbi:hypothetical protein PC110_g16842 [Phytophthora cactorum]|uniref:Reverse transcriptase Ty1/copia-type domain-containing protein n=1 Tax=Phytophthora cactorum TaxID=29920 RepID=A0A329RQ53_9STRA|nr:hypothetical protein PC110_g16842 [Phytophthora cactorum]
MDITALRLTQSRLLLLLLSFEWTSAHVQAAGLGLYELVIGNGDTYIPGQAMWISQREYTEMILKRFEMDQCRAVGTPQAFAELPLPATSDQDGVNDSSLPYRKIVGCLQYLVQCSRAGQRCAHVGQVLNTYTQANFTMAKRVLWYLRGTVDYGLVWEVESPDLHFTAYADADLGNEKMIDSRSDHWVCVATERMYVCVQVP